MGLSFLVSTRANASILSLNGGFHKLLHILNIEIINLSFLSILTNKSLRFKSYTYVDWGYYK